MPAKLRRAVSPARKLAAETVRAARAATGWTQERVEQELGVSARTVGAMERGEVPMRALELVIGLRLAAAGSSREERMHAPAIASVVDGAASRLANKQQIIMGPANRFGGGKPIARDTSGVTAPSSRAKHEGLATPVISAGEQVVSPGSVGSHPADLGGAQIAVAQPGSALGFTPKVARSNRASGPVVGSIPTSASTGAGCDASDGERGLVPSQVGRRGERSTKLRAAAASQAPTCSAGSLEWTGKAVLGRAANFSRKRAA